VTHVEELYSQVKVEDNVQHIIIQHSQTQITKKKIERKQKEPKKRLSKNADKKCSNKKQKVEGKVEIAQMEQD
jgi:hypothetical protein